jgi:hypothetical protein
MNKEQINKAFDDEYIKYREEFELTVRAIIAKVEQEKAQKENEAWAKLRGSSREFEEGPEA